MNSLTRLDSELFNAATCHYLQSREGTIMRKLLVATLAIFVIGISSQSAQAMRPSGCSTFSSGRTTCSQTYGGTTTYQSYNPYSGYSSNGSRTTYGSNSYGSNSYSSPSSNGYRSYNSSGLGSGSTQTNSYGYNSKKGFYSNSYSSCYFNCP